MFGGLLTSFAMELLVYPVILLVAKQFEIRRAPLRGPPASPVNPPPHRAGRAGGADG